MDFTGWVEWAELNGIKFNFTAYKKCTQCTELVTFINKTLFEKDVKKQTEKSKLYRSFLRWKY